MYLNEPILYLLCFTYEYIKLHIQYNKTTENVLRITINFSKTSYIIICNIYYTANVFKWYIKNSLKGLCIVNNYDDDSTI